VEVILALIKAFLAECPAGWLQNLKLEAGPGVQLRCIRGSCSRNLLPRSKFEISSNFIMCLHSSDTGLRLQGQPKLTSTVILLTRLCICTDIHVATYLTLA
jgi:hypothetical protein